MPGNSVFAFHTGKRMIPHFVTMVATSRAVTLAGVDVNAEAVTHHGDKLCWSEMKAEGGRRHNREPASCVLDAQRRESCQISNISLLKMIEKEGLVDKIDFDTGSLLGNADQALGDHVLALPGGDVIKEELGKVWQVVIFASLEELEGHGVRGEEGRGVGNQ